MTVEYLVAWEDQTWGTYRTDVPEDQLNKRTEAGDDDATLGAWARQYLDPLPRFRKAVAYAVLSVGDES